MSGASQSTNSNAKPDSAVDHERIERAVREILLAVGDDPDREGLRETPARVARMYAELFSGLHINPQMYLEKFFTEKYDEVVLVRDISFCSVCEHHLMPFMGKAHIGYMPAGKVIGLSKLARVVEAMARRPQVQERMTEEIADLLLSELGARGVAVVIEATHTCMTVRGVRKPGSLCVTSAMKGIFRSNLSTRSEIMQLIYGGQRVSHEAGLCGKTRADFRPVCASPCRASARIDFSFRYCPRGRQMAYDERIGCRLVVGPEPAECPMMHIRFPFLPNTTAHGPRARTDPGRLARAIGRRGPLRRRVCADVRLGRQHL